jgi:hypothetical protein
MSVDLTVDTFDSTEPDPKFGLVSQIFMYSYINGKGYTPVGIYVY